MPTARKETHDSEKSCVILVAGMHRSGTSAVTRVLNLLGAALPENLLPPLPKNNELGFWESHELWELHEKLLDEISSSWDDPTPFPENWLQSLAAQPYKQKFSQFLTSKLSDAPLSVIKDPRICKFLELWKLSVEEAGRIPLAVIPYRNPVEVAWSLKERDQLPPARSYLMWLRHILQAERGSRTIPRAFVDFTRLLDDWVTVTNRISRQLGLSWPCNILKANNEIDAFLKRRRHSYEKGPKELDARDDVPDWVKRIYKLLPRLELDPVDLESINEFDRVQEELATADAIFSPALSEQGQKLKEMNEEADSAKKRIKEMNEEADSAKKRLAELNSKVAGLTKTLEEKRTEFQRLQSEADLISAKWRDLQSISLEANFKDNAQEKINESTAGTDLVSLPSADRNPHLTAPKTAPSAYQRIVRKFRLTPTEKKLRIRQICENLINSGLFDIDFYQKNNPDIVQHGIDPVEHYVKFGAAEGRLPNPLFDTLFLSRQICPEELTEPDLLLHFIHRGVVAGINPHPLFDLTYYLETNPDVASSGLNPLAHYLRFGWREYRNPSIYFDSVYYETQLTAPLQEIGNPLVHYLQKGAQDGLDPHPLFDSSYYLSNNCDIRKAGINPLIHYIEAGAREGRDPHPLFDLHFYRTQFRDDDEFTKEPLQHYLECGALCGLDPNPYFDSAFYLSQDKNLVRKRVNPLSHYIQWGAAEGRATSRLFDTRLYLEAHPDLPKSGVNPLSHFISHSVAEGRHAPLAFSKESKQTGTYRPTASNVIRLPEADLSAVLDMPTPPEVPLDPLMAASTRLVAFYLPQFHPIPENDIWWGPGFTEWTNVVRAQSFIEGPLQPKLPGELGFYDLRLPEVRERQAELARSHGINAFCYHYYWFNGKKLLSRPLDEVIATGKPDFPFCVCWANENWTRRWDGLDDEILIAQTHSLESDRDFIREIIPLLEDRRYLRVEGRPILLVYRPDLLYNSVKTAELWREECLRAGVGEIYLCAVQFRTIDPRPLGFDAATEFPPHHLKAKNITNSIARHLIGFHGRVFDLTSAIKSVLESKSAPDYTHFRGVMPGWNNLPRRLNQATIYAGGSPAHYAAWLRNAINFDQSNGAGRDNLVFINAWNEWAEGAVLEPNQIDGNAYLEATLGAIDPTKSISEVPRCRGDELADQIDTTHTAS